MLKIIVFGLILLFFAHRCTKNHSRISPSTAKSESDSSVVQSDTDTLLAQIDFETDIRPIFQNRCMPCHFPGGKMYERLPFDKAQTIIDNREGILKRIKDQEDLKKLKVFLEAAQD